MYINTDTKLTRHRLGLIEFARLVNPTHLVTLNFHALYERKTAELKLGRWYTIVNRELFGKLRERPDERIEFVAFPEYTRAGHIHFHALTRLPLAKVDKFVTFGSARWKRIVPTSTFDVQPILQGPDDLERVLLYVTKSESAVDVIHSTFFHR